MDVTKNGSDGELIRLGPIEVVFFADHVDTDGHLDLYEVRVAPGARVPGAHHHVDMDEVILGLEGVMTYVVDDRIRELAALVAAGGPPDLAKIGAIMKRYGLEPRPLPESIRL